jgi:hypothetical protein
MALKIWSKFWAHYRAGHNDSEIGFEVPFGADGAKKVMSANLTHRGIIPGAAVKNLGQSQLKT